VREAGDVERRAPRVVAVLGQVQVVAGAVERVREDADAAPVVGPLMEQTKLRRARLDLEESTVATRLRRR
jgi:hypothetical protein